MNDLISRKDAIEWCLEGLNSMPSAQSEQKWIPVSERLPEEGQETLITIKKGVVVSHGYCDLKTVWHAMYHKDDVSEPYFCLWADDSCLRTEVIAWMPLPEPYKGE